ncbi:hypothetical protein FE634_22015 [Nocardioides dongxiaopingii]|uniref:beta-propeller domain-containing protein n=1 Tax=Nocardioides sp. S-1144 TaxID=2582905 RepID=UPI001163E9B8|nr:beta-propeller domain-containing protein [Nocardioides sp. S-1144]QDH11087.1 hypothetical protein FE634_22015 [Nocardioides sp. S-1144]
MTDLERQWDDLPVGPVPLDAILREARREAATETRRRPERRLRRSLTGVAVVGGIAAAFVAGTLVVQQDPPGEPPLAGGPGGGAAAPDLTPAAFHGELQEPASCDDLLEHYVGEGLDRVSRWGWDGGYAGRGLPEELRLDDAFISSEQSMRSASAYTSVAKATETGTNVQEAGVDEPDHVKTDGEVLVRLRGAELTTYDVSGEEVAELGSLDLDDFHDGEILLTGDRVVAIGNDGTRGSTSDGAAYRYAYAEVPSPQTRVLTVDLTDPAAPTLEQTVDYDASLVAARQHGTDVRLVLSKGLPDLDLRRGGNALEANRRAVEDSTLDDWLPHVAVDGGEPTDLLDCDRVAIPRADLGLATMAVVGFGADAPGEVESLGLAGDAPLTYESTDHLYLASSGPGADCWDLCGPWPTANGFDGTTHVYDFALDGTGASYVGAGEVEGTVRDRWSMDEADGVLRLAVGPSSETGRWNSIVTLRAEGDALVEVGRIDRLGVDEDIKAVRWFEDLALLVTFRQVDPLYAIDLGDVSRPTLLGELKIPGFSTYLHPLGPRRLVGVGTGPQGPRGASGAQAGLFDVTDVTDPVRLDVRSFGRGTYARAGDDPRQFTWLPEQRIALTVVSRGRTGYVAELRLGGGRMREELTRVEFGSDVAEVRLVPLPAGRVALVTGEDVDFLDLG